MTTFLVNALALFLLTVLVIIPLLSYIKDGMKWLLEQMRGPGSSAERLTTETPPAPERDVPPTHEVPVE